MPPCPHAKKAWLDGNVEIKKFVNYDELEYGIKDIVGSKVKISLNSTLSPCFNEFCIS